ncbi:MAG: glycosyltransferase family 39 protein [Candidatus Pacearchaeota archaeon]|nr:glycosyltransferase family 39 protein [Candidatus Pacearchaeota archaeon]
MAIADKKAYAAAFLFMGLMLGLAFLSVQKDSLTFDELAHIPAGYSYLTQQDYRINPEHPPLAKDLSGIGQLFVRPTFPATSELWRQDAGAPPWWIQFDLGTEFLFRSGNNPKEMITAARIPMLLFLLGLGILIFMWARKLGGNAVGLMSLFLFAFSPTFLAHGHLVATDVAAAFGVVLATFFWIRMLGHPSPKNVLLAGLALGVAELLKFSLILLIPFLGILSLVYPLLYKRNILPYLGKSVLAGLAALLLVIWPVYAFHTLNYPPDRQVRDTISDLSPGGITPIESLIINLSDKPVVRPLAQYARGVSMVLQRSTFGNTTYFMGAISASAFRTYFPILNILKPPLALLALNLIVLPALFIFLFLKPLRKTKPKKILKGIPNWIRDNFTVASFILFVNLYWIVTTTGNLNIGFRHLLPIFPFNYILLSWAAALAYGAMPRIPKRIFAALLIALFAWYGTSSLTTFPHYLSYYNELAGGRANGYKIAVDSNYDWGQDFGKLVAFVNENNIKRISLDYFGGEDPSYYLKDRYVRLNPKEVARSGEVPKGWIAVSVNQLMGGIAKPVPGFDQETGYYDWLYDNYVPVARAGDSIFIYHIE